MIDLIKNRDVLVIGNALSLDKKKLDRELEKKPIVVAFNKGVTRYKSDIALFNVADMWIPERIKREDVVGIVTHVSPRARPSEVADFEIPLDFIDDLRKKVGNRPSAGCIFNTFLSSVTSVKSVTLIGFDFKETPSWYDLKRTKEPHDYSREREYTINYLVNKKGFRII